MWFQVIALCLLAVGVQSNAAVSEQYRVDGNYAPYYNNYRGYEYNNIYKDYNYRKYGYMPYGYDKYYNGRYDYGRYENDKYDFVKYENRYPYFPLRREYDYNRYNNYAYPQYKFEYFVNDPYTGDRKFQKEYRDGDYVRGSYALVEPYGNIRSVNYKANDYKGFNAEVIQKTVHYQPYRYQQKA